MNANKVGASLYCIPKFHSSPEELMIIKELYMYVCPIILAKFACPMIYQLPYTAKLSRGKTFAVFAVLRPTTNVLQRIVN